MIKREGRYLKGEYVNKAVSEADFSEHAKSKGGERRKYNNEMYKSTKHTVQTPFLCDSVNLVYLCTLTANVILSLRIYTVSKG